MPKTKTTRPTKKPPKRGADRNARTIKTTDSRQRKATEFRVSCVLPEGLSVPDAIYDLRVGIEQGHVLTRVHDTGRKSGPIVHRSTDVKVQAI